MSSVNFANAVSTSIPNFTFSNLTAVGGVEQSNIINTTNAGGFNDKSSICRLKYTFISNGYFAQNPDGHFAIILRLDPTVIAAGQLRGNGIVKGNLTEYPGGRGNPLTPSSSIETFYSGLQTNPTNSEGNDLLPESHWNNTYSDGVSYTVIIDSAVKSDKVSYTRYQIISGGNTLFDSGELPDGNLYYDRTQRGIAFLHVFGNAGASAWNVQFSNISVQWVEIPIVQTTYPRAVVGPSIPKDPFVVGPGPIPVVSPVTEPPKPIARNCEKRFREVSISTESNVFSLDNIVQESIAIETTPIRLSEDKTKWDVFSDNSSPIGRFDKGFAVFRQITPRTGFSGVIVNKNKYLNRPKFLSIPIDVVPSNIVLKPGATSFTKKLEFSGTAQVVLGHLSFFNESSLDTKKVATFDSVESNIPYDKKGNVYFKVPESETELDLSFFEFINDEPESIEIYKKNLKVRLDVTCVARIDHLFPNGTIESERKPIFEDTSITVDFPLFVGQKDYCDEIDDGSAVGIVPLPDGGTGGPQIPERIIEKDPAKLVELYTQAVKGTITAPVSGPMFASLVSVAATMGLEKFKNSAISLSLNAGDYLTAAASFLRYTKREDGTEDPALKAQREREMDQFLSEGYIDVLGEWQPTPQYLKKNPETRPQLYPNDPVGFSDPAKVYPKKAKEPDTSRLARGENIRESIVWKKEQAQHKAVPIANSKDKTWDQAPSGYNAKYPMNRMTQSESGHVMELDDTPGSERINFYHRMGTFWEVDNNGTSVRRTVGDGYEIIENNGYVRVRGDVNVCVGGAKTLRVENTLDVEVHGATNINIYNNATVKVGGNADISVTKSALLEVRENATVKVGANLSAQVFGSTNVVSDGDINVASKSDISFRGRNFYVDADNIHLNSNRAKVANGFDWRLEPIIDKPVAAADNPPKTTFNRAEEAGAQFETPDDGTPAEIETHKNKRVEEGTASKKDLDQAPDTKEKAGATGGITPKDVPVTVPTGREFRADDKISKYFTLGDMTMGYTRKLTNQSGTTPEQAFANMCYLATNVLDVLKEKYPNMKINSGYRLGSGASQHNKGEAVDISFPGMSRADLFNRIKEVEKLVPYDQMLLEYLIPGGNGWIHISLAKRAPRKQAFTMVNHKRISNIGEFVQVA